MATLEDVRRLALALPEVEEGTSYGSVAWKVRGSSFVWERPLRAADREQLGADAPAGVVLGAHVADLGVKQALLEELVVEAWRAQAPKRLAQAYDAAPEEGREARDLVR